MNEAAMNECNDWPLAVTCTCLDHIDTQDLKQPPVLQKEIERSQLQHVRRLRLQFGWSHAVENRRSKIREWSRPASSHIFLKHGQKIANDPPKSIACVRGRKYMMI